MGEHDLKTWLLWCRQNRFNVREIEADGVRLVLTDMGDPPPAQAPPARSAHEAFAQRLGIDYSEDDDEEAQA
jgi:hypothetical protein